MASAARRPRRSAKPAAPTTPDPVEIAMEAVANGGPLAGTAERLLLQQEKLVGWQVASERLSVALKLLAAAAGLAVVVGLVMMAWRASRDYSVVIREFSVPPAYAARGLTGGVVAGRLIDKLVTIRNVTANNSAAPGRDLRAGGEDIRVEIPQTGVSLGEFQRLMTQWLGHQTGITGALNEEPGGAVTLSARLGQRTLSVTGPADDLDSLVQRLAEQSFAAYDPSQWIIYLTTVGRHDDALAAAQASARGAKPGPQRDSFYSLWAMREGDPARQIELLHRAIAGQPRTMVFRVNLIAATRAQGDEEAAFEAARRLMSLPAQNQRDYMGRGSIGIARWRNDALYGQSLLQGAAADAMPHARPGFRLVSAAAQSHDGGTTRRLLREAIEDEQIAPDDAAFVRVLQAQNAGDWPAMRQRIGEYVSAREARYEAPAGPGLPPLSASPPQQQAFAARRARRDDPLLAEALARSGDVVGARMVAFATPLDCAPCLRSRALVESAAGNWPAADAWFARAAAFTPSLPQAETLWAESLLARGDAAGAAARAASAHAKGPRFPDPLELWGEALAAQGKSREAADRYARAAALAPRWGRLYLKWGEALARLGKAEEARTKWRAATTMDLTPAEQAAVEARLAGRA